MKTTAKTAMMALAFIATFGFGFVVQKMAQKQTNTTMKKVTGIGGIFFKCKDPNKTKEWYKTHLGLNTNDYGANFEWREEFDSTKKGSTAWSPFKENTTYFGNSGQAFMINYRVENLEQLVDELKKEGVTIVDSIASYDYGKFVHILDGDGNQVELWEPKD